MSSGLGWQWVAGSRVKPKPGRTCSARRAHRCARMSGPRDSPACVLCGIVHVRWNVTKDQALCCGANSCLVHEPATNRHLLPAAVAIGGVPCFILPHHVVLTACRQGVETILPMWLDGGGLGWHRPCTKSRRVRPWFAYAGLDCGNAFEGYGMGFRWPCPNFRLGGGFASWVHGGRERSPLAFNSRSGMPRPGGWHKYAGEKHMPPTMELRTGVDYRMQVGIAWPVPGMRIPPGTTGWLN